MDRRNFIRNISCGAMGSTTLLSSLTSLGALNGLVKTGSQNLQSPPEDYKALVCILFAGGIDSYNMLIPNGITAGNNGFNDYSNLRTDLKVVPSNTGLLGLNSPVLNPFRGRTSAYSSFGLHPQMTGLQTLFNNDKLAFVSNVGTLVEPINNRTEYYNGIKKLPLGIYSHSDQIQQWQTSVPQSRSALGVGGRIADLINAQNTSNEISMNISLSGKNVFQRGAEISEYSISENVDPNNVGLENYPSWWSNSGLLSDIRKSSIDSLVGDVYANLLQKTYATTGKKSLAAFDTFKNALKKVPSLPNYFPANNYLGADLQAIAKVISVRKELGLKRQIFFVTYGGWDMHDDLIPGLNNKLPQVSAAMKAFYDTTAYLGLQDNVTTFTISDFARTLTSNGDGSDHAWGGNSMVMGGAVNPKRIIGAFPKLDVSSNNNIVNVSERGNYIPTVSTDEMYAELALWYGVSPADLCYVLPNLGNFYNYSPNNYPLGLMNFNGTAISTTNHPLGCLTY